MEHEPPPSQAAAVAAPARLRARGLLRRNPDFARLYAAQLISFGGDWFSTVALLTLVLAKTGRPALAGLLMAAQTLPFAIVSPFAGVIVDRLDRKTVMIGSDVARALLALGLLAGRSAETIWIAFVCVALISAISAFFDPASSAALPNLVAPGDLPRANALMGSAWGTMLAVGAALGGLVAGTLGDAAAFIGDAASFAISGALILSVRGRFREEGPPRPHGITIAEDVRDTIAFARRERRVLALLVVKGGFGLAGGVIVLVSVFAVQVFHGGAGALGLLMSARGVGALTGPFIFQRWVRGRDDRLFAGISVAFMVFALGYTLFAVSPNIALAAVAVSAAHIGGGAQWVLSTYGLQRYTPDAIRGRVFSFDYGFVTLTIGASMYLSGVAAGHLSPRTVALGTSLLAIAWSVAWTVWRRRLLRGAPAAPAPEPAHPPAAAAPEQEFPRPPANTTREPAGAGEEST